MRDPFPGWLADLRAQAPPIEVFDAHTHIGQNDPDEFTSTRDELLATLDGAQARGRGVPHARAGRLSARQRHGHRRCRGERRPADRVLPPRSARRIRWPRPSAAWPRARLGSSSTRGPRTSTWTRRGAGRRVRARARAAAAGARCTRGAASPRSGRHAVNICERYPDVRLILAHAGHLRPGLDLARPERPPQPVLRHLVVVAPATCWRSSRWCRRATSCSPATRPTAPRPSPRS